MGQLKIQLKNIYYKYPSSEKNAIDGISLNIRSGEKIVVLGENGMGKSTLFYLLNGVFSPNSGEILLNGKTINKRKLFHLRESLGLVFQEPETQFIAPTVEEEISFGPLNQGKTQEEVRHIIDRVMELLNIKKLKEKSLYELSGGEKKLVSIASIVSMNPSIIVFDEPTAGLDQSNTKKFHEVLEILENNKLGLIISTHDINFAWEWSDRTVIIKNGKILADGETKDILINENILNSASLKKPDILKFCDLINLKNGELPKNYKELSKILQ